jgi:5-methylcytosine-specific restriction endonuclease McrA
MKSTLVLNASYEPMSIVSGYRGVNLVLQGKAVSIDDSSLIIRSPELEIAVPYVIKLNYYVNTPPVRTRIPFSRRGIMARDGNKCVYCGKTATTIDHIIPKSKGGENTYQNCVASCIKCNSHKKDLTLNESGLKLRHQPYEPSVFTSILFKAMHDEEMFNSWANYVFMYQPNLKDSFMFLTRL